MGATPDPRIGSQLGAYRIEALIGRGGMGVVYRATDTNLDRPVALKLLAPGFVDDEAFRARFLRESKMAAAIDHPNIIPIYEAGERDGTYFLAMRFVDGTDLASRLRAGPLAPRAAVSILAQVAGALDAAHAAGLVHRDVKPANLLVASGHGIDRDDHVYLTDFGLTKQRGSETGLTRSGSFLGTLEYVAPEQIEGRQVDGRADQYALAAIAVECLTGVGPYPRDSDLAIVNAHLRDAPPSLHLRRAELPIAVDAVIARGLAKDPADRYPDCRTFVDELRSALGVTGTQPRPTPRAADRRIPIIVGALVAVAALAGVGFALTTGGSPGASASPGADAASPTASTLPSAAASSTEDVFPDAAEAALLEKLPKSLAAACERGSYDLVRTDFGVNGHGKVPAASVSCRPTGDPGVNIVLVRAFEYGGADFNVDTAVSGLAAAARVPGGDCASSRRANGRWKLGGEDAGAIVCWVDSSTGDAILAWSYPGSKILVKATNQRGDSAALYAWFEQNARFIAP